MSCTYNGLSYDELINKILNQKKLDNLDIVYSIEQDTVYQRLSKLKDKNKALNFNSLTPGNDFSFGGDPIDKESKSRKHLTHFFNDPRFSELVGRQVLPTWSDNDFIKNRALILQEKDSNLSEEEAVNIAKNELIGYNSQKIDAFILHYLIRHQKPDSSIAEIREQLNDIISKYGDKNETLVTRCKNIQDNRELLESILSCQNEISSIHVRNMKNSKVIYDIPLIKKLKTNSGEIEIFDQIDRVVIDANGYIQIYKIKIAEENTSDWGNYDRVQSPKVENYRYELAFIKVLLEDANVLTNNDTKKVSLHLITVQTNYNHDEQLSLQSISKNPKIIQMDSYNGRMQMGKHITIARNIIQPQIPINISESTEKINKHLNRIWIGQNIQAGASTISVEDWITQNKNKAIRSLYPKPGEANQNYYEIVWKGERIPIKEKTDIEHNEEIRQKVSKMLNKNSEYSETILNNLQRVISQVYETDDPEKAYINPRDLRGFSLDTANNICEMLSQYFKTYITSDGKTNFEWELLKNNELLAYNILLFKNKSGQIDIINLTDLNLDSKIKLRKGSNIAGSYLTDINANQLPSTWANIQAIKTMVILNYIIPNISESSYKLGNIKVITSFNKGKSKTYNIQNLLLRYYSPLIKIVNINTPNEEQLENNFGQCQFIDKYVTLVSEFRNIVGVGGLTNISQLADKVQKLEDNCTASESFKIELLLDLANEISQQYGYSSLSSEAMAEKYERSKNNDNIDFTLKLLFKINDTINYLRGESVYDFTYVPALARTFLVTKAIPANNFKVVLKFYDKASQKINNEAYEIGLEINRITQDFYKACGYSNFQNKTIGNQTAQFKNLFENNQEMRFKNPYDQNNDLKDYERIFLKKVLLLFAKYRYMNNGMTLTLSDPDSKQVIDFVEKNKYWYFNCPLKKASSQFSKVTYNIKKLITDPKLWAKEFFDEEFFKEFYKNDANVTQLSLFNYFSLGETSLNDESFDNNSRDNQLILHEDTRYFEHNVENLLRDFSFEAIRVQNMTKMMFGTKLFLMQMHISKRQNNDFDKDFDSEMKYIEDFLKYNVFSIPLMEETEQHLAKIILPVRNLVRKIFLMGNVSGEVRDVFEGFGQIMARAVTKYNTDITPKDVLKAYNIVTKECIENSLTGRIKAGIVSQLCIKYRLSNIDISNVAEGMKTGNKGLNHFQDELFRTIKDPDFLNRMVLFVAQCLHDGVWDAFYLNDNGDLSYDWKKDKRFNLLVNNQTNSTDYSNQKSLFYSLIRIWNEEHPNKQVKYDVLPMPYSELDITKFEHLADNIWGGYDKSVKALGEHSLLMMTFGMFTTWMNGQIENYFKPLQIQDDQYEWKQETDFNGNLLFFEEDGTITTRDTGNPVMKQVPLMVQGIWQTLVQISRTIFNENGNLKEDVFSSKVNQDNMKKLVTDATMTLIYYTLIKLVLQAFRDKQEEIVDPHNYFTNAVCEVLYKGMYSAWDGFAGPYNLIKYLGESTNPPIYQEGVALVRDLLTVVSGDMSILSYGSRHFAPLRPFKRQFKLMDQERKEQNN